MIERIENLQVLKDRLEAAYDAYSQNNDDATLAAWQDYLDQNSDQLDFCVNVLLNKEKEKQLAVLQVSEMKRNNSQPFLRDTIKNLTVKILLYILEGIKDDAYFEARQKFAETIQAKLRELNLEDGFSDDERDEPEQIGNEARREKIKTFLAFLADLPHPILNSERLKITLLHLAKIDLQNIQWMDKAHNLIAQSDARKNKSFTGDMQKYVTQPLNKKNQESLQRKYDLLQLELTNPQKAEETYKKISQRTEKYLADLDQEITDEITAFFEDNPGYWLKLTLDNEEQRILYPQNGQLKIGNEVVNLPIQNGKLNGLTIISAKEFLPQHHESSRNSSATAKSIDEKFHIRHQSRKLEEILHAPQKTPLEKIQDFSETLFAKPDDAKPTLAKRIESTKTGFDYVKDVAAILTSGVAFASLVGIIPMVIYRWHSNKWLWESHRGNFLDDAKAASTIQTKFQSKKGTR